MVLEKYISKLLFEHDCVIVPGFGGFIANYTPAGIHPVHHTFSPPSRNLAFNSILSNNDGLLADAIKNDLKITFTDATNLISAEVGQMMQKLENREKVSLAHIGVLTYNREKNIQFTPDHSFNYNPDSFGLTTFSSPAIKREALHEKISRKLMPQQAVLSGRRLPATLKWAAVMLPLITIGLWSAFNTDKISSLYDNYASFIPSASHTASAPGKSTAKPKANTRVISALPAEAAPVAATPTPEANNVVIETSAPDVFFIIAGAFGVEENAQKFAEDLRLKGYDSFIAGQNRRGLYRVSVEGFSDKAQAMHRMNEYRNGEFPGAWLLSME
ncbi:MAG: cell division protein [Bacteroidetes bacterium]|nr:MAG: cell division protein [Bacteroidota bacterium]